MLTNARKINQDCLLKRKALLKKYSLEDELASETKLPTLTA